MNANNLEPKEEEIEEVVTTIKDSAPDVISAMDMDISQRIVLKQIPNLNVTTVNNLVTFQKTVLMKELKERNQLIVSAAEMMVTSLRTVPKRLESVSNVINKDTLLENAQARRKDDVIYILFSLTIIFFRFFVNTLF